MEIVIFAVILYILVGAIRVVNDFVHRWGNPLSVPFYVIRPTISTTLIAILIWPLVPISSFMRNIRRMNFKYAFDFYLVGLFYGSSGFVASILGLTNVFAGDDIVYLKTIKVVGILIVFGAIIWWLYSRNRKLKEKNIKN